MIKERRSPCFEVQSSQIQILRDPVDYYLALHKLTRQARERICMSGLYLGTGKLERYLVEKLDNKLERERTLRMSILLDYMRGTRVNKDGNSSLSLLKPLKEKHLLRPSLRLGFWHHPDTGVLQGKYSSSPLKEIFGVQHIKAHVFDHTVMVTGANLSEDYFTDRQDRCYVIEDCEPLANYVEDMLNMMIDGSYNVNESGQLQMMPEWAEPYKAPRKYRNQLSQGLRFFRYTHRTVIPKGKELSMEEFFAEDKAQESEHMLLPEQKKSKP